MTSFQAKTDWERPRKRKKKLSFRSVLTRPRIENSKKKAKNSKTSLWLLVKPKREGTS